MKKAIFLVHYGTKIILNGDTLHQDIEHSMRQAYPGCDVFSFVGSRHLSQLIKEQNAPLLTMNELPYYARNYDSICAVTSYLTMGTEWMRIRKALESFSHINVTAPLFDRFHEQISEKIIHALDSTHTQNSDVLLLGHGGAGSDTQGYHRIHQHVQHSYPEAALIFLEEKESYPKILQHLSRPHCLLLPLRFNSSPFNAQKIYEAASFLPHKNIEFLWDRLADIGIQECLLKEMPPF